MKTLKTFYIIILATFIFSCSSNDDNIKPIPENQASAAFSLISVANNATKVAVTITV